MICDMCKKDFSPNELIHVVKSGSLCLQCAHKFIGIIEEILEDEAMQAQDLDELDRDLTEAGFDLGQLSDEIKSIVKGADHD